MQRTLSLKSASDSPSSLQHRHSLTTDWTLFLDCCFLRDCKLKSYFYTWFHMRPAHISSSEMWFLCKNLSVFVLLGRIKNVAHWKLQCITSNTLIFFILEDAQLTKGTFHMIMFYFFSATSWILPNLRVWNLWMVPVRKPLSYLKLLEVCACRVNETQRSFTYRVTGSRWRTAALQWLYASVKISHILKYSRQNFHVPPVTLWTWLVH